MIHKLPPDLVESALTTLYIAIGYVLRWVQNKFLNNKQHNNANNSPIDRVQYYTDRIQRSNSYNNSKVRGLRKNPKSNQNSPTTKQANK